MMHMKIKRITAALTAGVLSVTGFTWPQFSSPLLTSHASYYEASSRALLNESGLTLLDPFAQNSNFSICGHSSAGFSMLPPDRSQYDDLDIENAFLNTTSLVGNTVLIGNTGFENRLKGRFQQLHEGLTVYGNLSFRDITAFQSDLPEISRMAYMPYESGELMYTDLPFIYVDGTLKTGVYTVFGTGLPVNIYAGAIEFAETTDIYTQTGDLYLYDTGKDSVLSSNTGNEMCIMRCTRENRDGNSSNAEPLVASFRSNTNMYTGSGESLRAQVGGNVYCNNNSLTIGGKNSKNPFTIEGDLYYTNPNGKLIINGNLTVQGKIVCAGELIIQENCQVIANGGQFIYSGYTNAITSPPETTDYLDERTGTSLQYNTFGDYLALLNEVFRPVFYPLTDSSAADMGIQPFGFALFPELLWPDMLYTEYQRWDLASADYNYAMSNMQNDSLFQQLSYYRRNVFGAWYDVMIRQVRYVLRDDPMQTTTLYVPYVQWENNGFVPLPGTATDMIMLQEPEYGYSSFGALLQDYPDLEGNWLSPEQLPGCTPEVICHDNNGELRSDPLDNALLVNQSCCLDLSNGNDYGHELPTLFIDPTANGYSADNPLVVVLDISYLTNNPNLNILVNNTAVYDTAGIMIGTNEERNRIPQQKEVIIFLRNNSRSTTLGMTLLPTGMYNFGASLYYDGLNAVGNPVTPDQEDWQYLPDNLRYAYEMVPNAMLCGGGDDSPYSSPSLFTNEYILQSCIIDADIRMPFAKMTIETPLYMGETVFSYRETAANEAIVCDSRNPDEFGVMSQFTPALFGSALLYSLSAVNGASFVSVSGEGSMIAGGYCGDYDTNISWKLSSTGKLTLSGTGRMRDYCSNDLWERYRDQIREVEIGEGIEYIGYDAFSDLYNLTSVSLPSTLTQISDNAFCYCSNLQSIVIPEHTATIGAYSFADCTNLTDITIPESVTYIGTDAFRGTPWLSAQQKTSPFVIVNHMLIDAKTCTGDVTIPDDATQIGEGAFSGNQKVTGITIPNSVTSIGGSAFSSCTALTELVIPDSVTSIGGSAFSSCSKLESVTLPAGLKQISFGLFSRCSALKSVSIPDTVTSIGNSAFSKCTSLETFTLPAGLTSISSNSFEGCTALTAFAVSPDNTKYSTAGGVLFNADQTKLILCPAGKTGSYTVPDGTVSIDNYAFQKCNQLTGITIPEGVTSIDSYAFSNCSSLESVSLPDSLTIIDYYSFYYCSKLKSITIPDSVTTIDICSFYCCKSLTDITIPASVTKINSSAFSGCTNMTDITIMNPNCSINSGSYTLPEKAVIHGYSGSTAESYASQYSRQFAALEGAPQTAAPAVTTTAKPAATTAKPAATTAKPAATTAKPAATTAKPAATTAKPAATTAKPAATTAKPAATTAKPAATTAQPAATTAKPAVTTVKPVTTAPATTIVTTTTTYHIVASGVCGDEGENLVWKFDSAGTLTVSGTGNMKQYDMKEINKDNTITFRDSGTPWYKYRASVKKVVLEEGVTSIGCPAFACCTELETVSLPESLKEMKCHSFYRCSKLKSVSLPNGLTTIGSSAFAQCTALESITIPDHVTQIGSYSFNNCVLLKHVTIPESVETIGSYAFDNCSGLSDVKILNPQCAMDYYFLPSGVTIYGYADSTAQRYASNRSHTFVKLERVTTAAPAVTTAKPTVTTAKPAATTAKPAATTAKPAVTTAKPAVTTAKPAATTAKPAATTAKPAATTAKPAVTTAKPAVTTAKPAATTAKPAATTAKPAVTTAKPVATTAKQVATTAKLAVTTTAKPAVTTTAKPAVTTTAKSAVTTTTAKPAVTTTAKPAVTTTAKPAVTTTAKPATTTTAPAVEIIASGVCGKDGDNLTWTLDSAGTLTISGKGDMADWESEKAPWFSYLANIKTAKIEKGVTSIGQNAFDDCTELTSIAIPEGVTSIGYGAFELCSNLTSITIPKTVTSIGKYAFRDCEKLDSITILSPDCIIYQSSDTFSPYDIVDEFTEFHETFYGYTGSTAEAYAKKYGRNFVSLGELPAVTTTVTDITAIITEETTTVTTAEPLPASDTTRVITETTTMTDITTTTTEPLADITTTTEPETIVTTTTVDYEPETTSALPVTTAAPVFGTTTEPNPETTAEQVIETTTQRPEITTVQEQETIESLPETTEEQMIDTTSQIPEITTEQEQETIASLPDTTEEQMIDTTSQSPEITTEQEQETIESLPDTTEELLIETTSQRPEITSEYEQETTEALPETTEAPAAPEIIASGACGADGDNLTWTLSKDGTLKISGAGALEDYYTGWDPRAWDNLKVPVRSVIIEDGVERIGQYAFANSTLESVELPESLESIGQYAFANSTLESVELPESVESIEAGAFYECTELKSITVRNPMCEIADSPGTICNSHENGEYIFSGTVYGDRNSTAETFAIENGMDFLPLSEIAMPGVDEANVYQIDDVTGSLGETVIVPVYIWNDSGTAGFKMQFSIPEGLEVISCEPGNAYPEGNHEFHWDARDYSLIWCSSDGTSVTASPGSVIAKLEIKLPAEAPAGSTDSVTYPIGIYNLEISNGILEPVAHEERAGSVKMQILNAGDMVFSIGSDSGETGETARLPITVGFANKASRFELKLHLPDDSAEISVKFMSDSIYAQNGAFEWEPETQTLKWTGSSDTQCSSGTRIADILVHLTDTEPGTKLTVSADASAYDSNGIPLLATAASGTVTVTGDARPVKVIDSGTCGADGDNLTWTLDSAGTLTVSGTGEMQQWSGAKDLPWHNAQTQIKKVVLADGVQSVGDFAFDQCKDLESVVIPESVTSIGQGAFDGCSSLTQITLPESITKIGQYAFEQCTALSEINIPKGVEEIEIGTFSGCASLKEVTVPETVESIGMLAFYCCQELSEVTIENPSCTLYHLDTTISNTPDGGFSGTIRGYSDSSAEAYAKTFGAGFESIGEVKPPVEIHNETYFVITASLPEAAAIYDKNDETPFTAAGVSATKTVSVCNADAEGYLLDQDGNPVLLNGDKILFTQASNALRDQYRISFENIDISGQVYIAESCNTPAKLWGTADAPSAGEIFNLEYCWQNPENDDAPMMLGTAPVILTALNQTEWTPDEVAETLKLELPLPEGYAQPVWSTSNPEMLTVDGQGNVSLHLGGTAEITATVGDRSFVCNVNSVLRGDVNNDGEVTLGDAILTLRAYSLAMGSRESNLSEEAQKRADIDQNGVIGLRDAMLILRYCTMLSADLSPTWDGILNKANSSLSQ